MHGYICITIRSVSPLSLTKTMNYFCIHSEEKPCPYVHGCIKKYILKYDCSVFLSHFTLRQQRYSIREWKFNTYTHMHVYTYTFINMYKHIHIFNMMIQSGTVRQKVSDITSSSQTVKPQNHRSTERFKLEKTLEGHLPQVPCNKQGQTITGDGKKYI